MAHFCRNQLVVIVLSICGLFTFSPSAAAAQRTHLEWAEELVDNVAPELNVYASNPNYITWPGVNGAVQYSNHTVCTGFVTNLLKQAYGWGDAYMTAWMGSTGPNPVKYHDAIVAGNRFDLVETVADIEPGDIIAIRYPDGSTNSGHVAIVQDWPVLRVSTAPVITGTFQFAVSVVDSTKQGHGPDDTRRKPDGTWRTGAGIGTMRFYTGADLKVVGYTWSTLKSSEFESQSTNHMVIGRIKK